MTTIDTIAYRRHSYREPLVVMVSRWYRENQKAIQDLGIFALISMITFLLLIMLDFTEAFFEFTREHEAFQFDEFIITALAVFSLYLPIFTVRRWIESSNRLRQANTDSLTSLYNRRRGWEILDFEMARASRYERPLSVIFFDIDHFKDVNDRYGHLIGDQVLKGIAKIVQGQMRKTETVLRWGGEEFMIICTETDLNGASQLAERLRKGIQISTPYEEIQVTASFGVAEFQQTDTLESLVKRADERVYEAKEFGRNRVIGKS